jgi:hypothetical protein
MHSFIIGLEKSYRGAVLEQQLSNLGATVERVAGVLVNELPGGIDSYADQAGAQILLRRPLTSGEVGCVLAHRAAYAAFLRSNHRTVLIFEDDARLRARFDFEELSRLIEIEEPVVLLLYSWSSGLVAKRQVGLMSGQVAVWESSNVPLTATAYLLNRHAARILLDDNRLVNDVADWPARPAAAIRFFFSYPWLAEPAEDAVSTLNSVRISASPVDNGSRSIKIRRHLMAAAHVTWFRHRRVYGDYRTYAFHEFHRLVIPWLARRTHRNVERGNSSSPHLAFGTRRSHAPAVLLDAAARQRQA